MGIYVGQSLNIRIWHFWQSVKFVLIKWEPHTRNFSRELGDQASQRI